MENTFQIRKATLADAETIVYLVKQLAIYEKMEADAQMTVEQVKTNIFEKEYAHVILATEGNQVVGFALYFFNFSTFKGKPGLYLEDLFVEPMHRGKGYGKQLLVELAKIAQEKDCARMEWVVLDWNQPAIDFYTSFGAVRMNAWDIYRLSEDKISALAQQRTS